MSNDKLKPSDSTPPSEDFENGSESWLSQSIQNLPQVEVPANFLPNVMFKVYEKHSRNMITLPKFIGFTLIFLLASLVFFVWDVYDHMVSSGESSFAHAFGQRMDQALSGSQQIFADLGGLLTAAWQITLSALGAFFTQTSFLLQATVLLVLIAIVFLLKKGWSRLV